MEPSPEDKDAIDAEPTRTPRNTKGSKITLLRAAREWLISIILGGIPGGVVGGIAAMNLVIFAGVEGGYEATIPEVFRQNVFVGALTVMLLVAGPTVGTVIARRSRRRSRVGAAP